MVDLHNSIKKRKILFLVNGRLDSYKAYTNNFLNFIMLAKEIGFKTTACGLKTSKDPIPNNIADEMIIFTKSYLGIIKLVLTNFRYLISRNYDVVVLGSLYTWIFPIYYLAFKFRPPNRIIYYMQDPVPESRLLVRGNNTNLFSYFTFYFALLCEKLACKISNVLLLPSKGCFDIIQSRNKLYNTKIKFTYNIWGISKLQRANHTQRIKIIAKTDSIKDEIPILLYSGKLQRNLRGIEMQLRVLHRLIKDGSNIQLVLTGSGELDWFIELAKKLDVYNNTVFTGVLTDNELMDVYLSSDIMILPPVDYLLPSKFFEALNMGLIPIIWEKSVDMLRIMGENAITYDGTESGLYAVLKDVLSNITYHKERLYEARNRILKLRAESVNSFKTALMVETIV